MILVQCLCLLFSSCRWKVSFNSKKVYFKIVFSRFGSIPLELWKSYVDAFLQTLLNRDIALMLRMLTYIICALSIATSIFLLCFRRIHNSNQLKEYNFPQFIINIPYMICVEIQKKSFISNLLSYLLAAVGTIWKGDFIRYIQLGWKHSEIFVLRNISFGI